MLRFYWQDISAFVLRWFERMTMTVILLNCVTLGMYQPCQDTICDTRRCKILKVRDSLTCFIWGLQRPLCYKHWNTYICTYKSCYVTLKPTVEFTWPDLTLSAVPGELNQELHYPVGEAAKCKWKEAFTPLSRASFSLSLALSDPSYGIHGTSLQIALSIPLWKAHLEQEQENAVYTYASEVERRASFRDSRSALLLLLSSSLIWKRKSQREGWKGRGGGGLHG